MGDVINHAIAYVEKATEQLLQAFVAQDWEKIQGLDEKLRLDFVVYTRQLHGCNSEQLRGSLETLITLYRQVIAGCEEHRSQIREQMLDINKGQRGSRAYASVDGLQTRDMLSQPWQRR
jgi:flagellar protein FliT